MTQPSRQKPKPRSPAAVRGQLRKRRKQAWQAAIDAALGEEG